MSVNRCRWCHVGFEPPASAPRRAWCSKAHQDRWKRAQKAAHLSNLVEQLGPFIERPGRDTYNRLISHLRHTIETGDQ